MAPSAKHARASWRCSQCATPNWAAKSTCRTCYCAKTYLQAAKPETTDKPPTPPWTRRAASQAQAPAKPVKQEDPKEEEEEEEIGGKLRALEAARRELMKLSGLDGPLADIEYQIKESKMLITGAKPLKQRIASAKAFLERKKLRLAAIDKEIEKLKDERVTTVNGIMECQDSLQCMEQRALEEMREETRKREAMLAASVGNDVCSPGEGRTETIIAMIAAQLRAQPHLVEQAAAMFGQGDETEPSQWQRQPDDNGVAMEEDDEWYRQPEYDPYADVTLHPEDVPVGGQSEDGTNLATPPPARRGVEQMNMGTPPRPFQRRGPKERRVGAFTMRARSDSRSRTDDSEDQTLG